MNQKSTALSDKTHLYVEHHDMIQDLMTHLDEDYKRIFAYIESVIRNYFANNVDGEWKFDFNIDRGYHQIYKSGWKTNDLDIHFELQISRDSLIHHELSFLLDIEGPQKRTFQQHHDEQLKEQAADVFHRYNIRCREGKRQDTFASKRYDFLHPEALKEENSIQTHVTEMIEEFTGFVDAVDQELKHYNKRMQ